MKFLRTIQLDASDQEVYPIAATPGEWAVPGSFMFLNRDVAQITGKEKQAFNNGFIGVESFGWSTLVQVATIEETEYRRVIELLAQQFVTQLGAPDIQTALPLARQEAQYVTETFDVDPNTLFAIRRTSVNDEIKETLHKVQPTAGGHETLKIWQWDEES